MAVTDAPTPTRPALAVAGWGAAGAIVALVHNRWWASPNLAFMSAIAEHLGENPFRGGLDGDYLLTNLTGPVMARVLGQTAPHEYARLHLVVLLVGATVAIALAHRRFGAPTATGLVVVLAASPAVTVSMQWLGQPDPVTLSLGLAMTLVRSRVTLVVLAVAAGATHPEQAVFMAATAGVVRGVVLPGLTDDPPPPWRHLAAEVGLAVGGVVLGRLVTEVYLRLADIVITNPRTSFLDLGLDRFWEHHTQEPLALVYLLWGPLWVLWIAMLARRGSAASRRTSWVAAGLAFVALVPVAVTLDETRVYAMITAPLLVPLAVAGARLLGDLPDRARRLALVAALAVVAAVPGGFSTGIASWSVDLPAGEFTTFLRDGTHPDDLTLWLLGPFDFTIPTR